MRVLVVGAGFAGSVIARELALAGDYLVTVIDKRDHIGGNAYDPVHPHTGARYHRYGPHIFHTSNRTVFDYLSQFTEWVLYKHRVQAVLSDGKAVPMPVNKDSLNTLYGLNLLNEEDVQNFFSEQSVEIDKPANALEHLYAIYGREVTDLFFGRYTKKMWGLDLSDMPISLVARLPVRYDENPYYFDDEYQFMPARGYEPLIGKMLDHTDIEVRLETTYNKAMESDYHHIFNSMPIDEYFDNCFGPLPYRSIKFDHRFNEPFDFDVPTVNFTDDGPYTRKTSWALYPGCGGVPGGHVTYETPCSYEENNMERYYPIKTVDGWPQRRYKQYEELAKANEQMTFIGRCGQYVYYDMHQVVANSLKIVRDFL